MKLQISFPSINVPLECIDNVMPKYSHLRKLEHLPLLHPNANRRVINPRIDWSNGFAITKYTIDDYSDTLFRGEKTYTVEELDSIK